MVVTSRVPACKGVILVEVFHMSTATLYKLSMSPPQAPISQTYSIAGDVAFAIRPVLPFTFMRTLKVWSPAEGWIR